MSAGSPEASGAPVAVVGAGAAGLMAALDLRDLGFRPVVLEARDRVGGRIHTVRFPDGSWGNAGAEWLDRGHTLAHRLCRRYDLDLVDRFGFEGAVVDGVPRSRERAMPDLEAAFAELAAGVTDTSAPWADPHLRELDRISVADWAATCALDPATREHFLTSTRGEFMTSPERLSLAAFVIEHCLTSNDRAHRLAEGTAALPEAMAADLGADLVRLGEPVVAMRHDLHGVTLRTPAGSYEVAAVVLALPLPPLRTIHCEPPLRVPRVDDGRGGKLLVDYRIRGWTHDVAADAPDAAMEFVYETASHRAGPHGVLAAYSVDVLDTAEVLDTFDRWFPGHERTAAEPIAAWWSDDPASGTTYSAPQPGYLDQLRDLREPRGRVHFAGEHTEPMFGYIESALISGRRVAADIGRQLGASA